MYHYPLAAARDEALETFDALDFPSLIMRLPSLEQVSMIGASKSEQDTPPLPKLKPPKPSDQPIFPLPDNSSSLKPVTDPTDAATLSPSLALPPHAQDAPVEVNNVVVSSQEPHDAPTEEPSAEEPPEDHLPPQEPRDAPAEEPTAEEPPGSISIQPHGPEISHLESKGDDGHLQPNAVRSCVMVGGAS